jgi:F420-dependent oxidoreductase-like protein
MKVSTQVTYSRTFHDYSDRIARLERDGLNMVWVGEAYGFDAVARLGFLAARTERVVLASGILPVFSRTPALVAQAAATLDHLSNGRFELGLGASGPQVVEGWHGVPFDRPLQRTREMIQMCRQIWRGERLEHSGQVFDAPLPQGSGLGAGRPLRIMANDFRPQIPIHLAALGPANVELAAELADGWLTHLYWPERAADVWGPSLAAGRGRRDPALPSLEIAAGGTFAIGSDASALRDRARPQAALYLGGMGARGHNFYNDLGVRYGFAQEVAEVQRLFLAGAREQAAAAVPEPLLEAITVCGPVSYVRDRIAAYRAAGVTNLIVNPIGDDPVATFARVRELVG